MALINCPECEKEISDKAVNCPHCGFPVTTNNQLEGQNDIDVQMSENNTLTRRKPSNKVLVIIVVVICAIVIAIVAAITIMSNKNKNERESAEQIRAQYIEDMKAMSVALLINARMAEEAGGLLHDVWYNCIFKKHDINTDEYTKRENYKGDMEFYSDFNSAIENLYSDEDFIVKISQLKSAKENIAEYYGKLQNPPEGLEKCYDAMEKAYDTYNQFVGLVINPSGNISTYTQSFNETDKSMADDIDKLNILIPDE